MDKVEMRLIDKFGGNYAVTNDGRVYSYKTNKFLTLLPNKYGYLKAHLRHEGKEYKVSVHRLVAEAFIENPEGKSEVNHIDEDKTNNTVSNLEWCTRLENIRWGTGSRRSAKSRERAVIALDDNGKEVGRFSSILEASEATGIKAYNISRAASKARKHAGGLSWEYEGR